MKTLFAVLAVAVLTSSVAMAAPAPKATGDVDFTNGSSDQSLAFNAHDGGASADDKGQITYTNFTAGLTYSAPVLCANVNVGTSTAFFAYEIPSGIPGFESLGGYGILFKVVDGGTPGTNGDQISFDAFPGNSAAAVAACESATGGTSNPQTITAGNLVVHKK
jgi:hypothetical protein